MEDTTESILCHVCRSILKKCNLKRWENNEDTGWKREGELVWKTTKLAGKGWYCRDEEVVQVFRKLPPVDIRKCPLCYLFIETLPQDWKEKLQNVLAQTADQDARQPRFRYCALCDYHMGDTDTVTVPLGWIDVWVHKSWIQFGVGLRSSCWEEEPCDRQNDLIFNPIVGTTYRKISTSTRSSDSLALAKSWIARCVDSHPLCKRPAKRPFPSRLLYVGFEGDDVRLHILLENLVVLPEYTTLSHCWGGDTRTRLLQGNLDSMILGIKLESLPKTFRDAVYVTRALGIKYLWIDSLCIIQDKPEDWVIESTKMSSIYSNGLCNLAASNSPNPEGGFFHERIPELLHPVRVRLQDSVEPGPNFEVVHKRMWIRNIDQAPLNRRAWVTLERILSPRTLHFTSKMIYWECASNLASEVYSDTYPIAMQFDRTNFKEDYSRACCQNPTSPNAPETKTIIYGIIRFWAQVVSAYTVAGLTQDTDKLIALSGLAREIQRATDARYYAGLWDVDGYFITQLLWEVEPECRTGRYENYIAPSWSWASIKGPVVSGLPVFQGKEDWVQGFCEITSVDTEIATEDPFGQVKGGSVVIVGSLGCAMLEQTEEELWQDVADEDDEDGEVSEEAPAAVNMMGTIHWRMPGEAPYVQGMVTGTLRLKVDVMEELSAAEFINEPVFFLPIMEGNTWFLPNVYGLLLRRYENTPGIFTRWGMFHWDNKWSLQERCRIFDQHAGELGMNCVGEGRYGMKKYSITII